jgi:hypothetical protein
VVSPFAMRLGAGQTSFAPNKLIFDANIPGGPAVRGKDKAAPLAAAANRSNQAESSGLIRVLFQSISLSAVPTSGYVLLIISAIGLLLLLSPDFGKSFDVPARESGASKAYNFYFKGFDTAPFRASTSSSKYYGPAVDLVIAIAQYPTDDALQRLKIRTFVQGLISLSCLIPAFLISARVLSKPLALISVALLAATPVFFGHAFINPKDSIFASGFVWAFYLILRCINDERRLSYRGAIGLGALLGLVVSIRFTGVYLLLLILIAAIGLPVLRLRESQLSTSLSMRLWQQIALQYRELALLFITFALIYVLLMPAILADLQMGALVVAIRTFLHYPWPGTVLYFGDMISASRLPWHYVYGYMLVQLPLYYHVFLLTILGVSVASPYAMLQRLLNLWRSDKRTSTMILLFAGLVIPLAWILIARPVLYDAFRQLLFIVPLVCLLLYFGFIGAIRAVRAKVRWALILLATLGFTEAVLSMRLLHPYEYVYYNPLVKPSGAFELEYWGTSFRELAERLNDYAREDIKREERLRLFVCGPADLLTPFLDVDKFEIVGKDAAPQFNVALNRSGCMVNKPWLISISRRGLVFAVVARVEGSALATEPSLASAP